MKREKLALAMAHPVSRVWVGYWPRELSSIPR